MRIEARYPHLTNALVAIACSIIVLILLSSLLFGLPALEAAPGGELLGMVIFGVIAVWCGKMAIAPSLVFAADAHGVELGRGIFRNRIRRIPWSAVCDIERATLIDQLASSHSSHRERGVRHPAVRIFFEPGTEVGTIGFNLGFPEADSGKGPAFLLAVTLLGRSQTDALATLGGIRRRGHQGEARSARRLTAQAASQA